MNEGLTLKIDNSTKTDNTMLVVLVDSRPYKKSE
jgi:hypothetical protein